MDTIWPELLSQGDGPKYKSVAATIRQAVDDGRLKVGARLPPVRELAYQLGITPGTVARAYTVLTGEGVLLAEVGRGTFVAASKSPLHNDVWSRSAEPVDARVLNLFSPRLPDVGQVAAIRAAMRKVSEGDPMGFLNYPTRDAYRPVRKVVADWLSSQPLGPLDQADIVLTYGGQNGICVILQAILHGPRPVLLVEDLSYAGFRRAAELLRAEVVGVEMDEFGVIPDALDAAARQSGAQVFCTTPEVQNPTGMHTPLARRKELVTVSQRHNLQILEDDCYRLGQARAPSYRTLAPDRSWHVSSISKTLSSALRVGFALAPNGRGADLRRASEYGHFGLSQPLAELIRILLSDPDTRDLCRDVRECMAEYVRVAVNTLGGFDLSWDAEVPFIWLRLPPGWRAAAFCRAAEAEGVQMRSADEFALRNGRAPHAVRISVNAQVTLSSFENAMQRLRQLLDDPPEQISV